MTQETSEADGKLARFLSCVPGANWRRPPPVWNEQLRKALSDDLVTVGWGGILKLTEAGREIVDSEKEALNAEQTNKEG